MEVTDDGADCCTEFEDTVVTGDGTGTELERGIFPEDEEPEPEAERVEYPLDILETRFLIKRRR